MWLGSATLAGLLLASSLTASASSQTAAATTTITCSSVKPVLATLSIVPSGTYTEAVRKQMQWVSSPAIIKVIEKSVPTPSALVTVAVVKAQPAKPAEQPAKTNYTIC